LTVTDGSSTAVTTGSAAASPATIGFTRFRLTFADDTFLILVDPGALVAYA